MKWPNDQEFEDTTITAVSLSDDGWEITTDRGWSFSVDKQWGVEPKIGHSVRFYGEFGRPIRGLYIDGQKCFYRTPEQEKKHHAEQVKMMINEKKATFEKERAQLDAQYDALPEVFRRRIDKFRKNNPDFRWEFEAYESFVCTQAVAIAEALKTPKAIATWSKKSFEKQKRAVPALDEGHSGNTLGTACLLATLYLQNPEGVIKLHGALAHLVGSKKYGCVPRSK